MSAVAFHESIQLAQHLLLPEAPNGEMSPMMLAALVITPSVGGAVAGLFLKYAPKAAGSGIPQIKAAYSLGAGGVRFRDAAAKFVICTIQIGSGASLGREGPTVQICAGIATSLGRWLALSPTNLRKLIPVGASAGIAAAFNAPIAAVTFTIEEVVGTLDQTVLSGVVVAAALAAVVEHSLLGESPILMTPLGAGLHHVTSLPLYALLGIAAGLVSIVFRDAILQARHRFIAAKRIPDPLKPAIGGLATGLFAALALFAASESGIAGGGYETLTRALAGSLSLHVLAILLVLKLIATVASYSSGGAGGIFAPTLFIGAMLGGLVGGLDVALLDHAPSEELTSFALVGMGALFAGVIRAPITSVLIIFEMTHGYGLVLPLMIANSVAYLIARHVRPMPIYEALLEQDGIKLPHGTTSRGALSSIQIESAMNTDLVTMRAEYTLREAAEIARQHGFGTYPVLDVENRFVGLLSEARLQRSLAESDGARVVGEVAKHRDYCVPDESLLRAVTRMTRLGVRQLPVLERGTHRLVGMLAMSDIMRAQMRMEDTEPNSTDRFTLEQIEKVVDTAQPNT